MKVHELFESRLSEAEGSDQALKIAAGFLDVDKSKLKGVDPETEVEVLDTGREIKKQFVQMVHGKLFVRLYRAANKLFARIEYPDGENKLYTV